MPRYLKFSILKKYLKASISNIQYNIIDNVWWYQFDISGYTEIPGLCEFPDFDEYSDYDYDSHYEEIEDKEECLQTCLRKWRSFNDAAGCIFIKPQCIFLKTGTIIGGSGDSDINTCWKFGGGNGLYSLTFLQNISNNFFTRYKKCVANINIIHWHVLACNPACQSPETCDGIDTDFVCKCGTASSCVELVSASFCDATNNICKCSATVDACTGGQACVDGQCGKKGCFMLNILG